MRRNDIINNQTKFIIIYEIKIRCQMIHYYFIIIIIECVEEKYLYCREINRFKQKEIEGDKTRIINVRAKKKSQKKKYCNLRI